MPSTAKSFYEKVTRHLSLAAVLFITLVYQINGQTAPQLGKNTNAEVIAAMTLEEKVRLLVGTGMKLPEGAPPELQGPTVGITQDRVPGAAGTTFAIPRLGIPSLVLADGPAGLRIAPRRPNEKRTYYATAFPTATLLASTWDTYLVYKVGASMGNEVKEYGVDILLAPGMNIHRNPLGGRNFEYYSEDPILTGKIASAMVRGIQSNGVGASIKHFAANNHETNRMTIDVKVGERALREIYFRGFEIAVKEGKPWTVMSSYNKVNGTYTSESPYLLNEVLRKDWGFKGFVMTDWFAGSNPLAQVKAGNNLIMPGLQLQIDAIIDAVRAGQLEENDLERNIDEILGIIRLSPSFKGSRASNRPNLKASAMVARQAAAEGMVLLKNEDKALPLSKRGTIAAFGNHSYDLVSGGSGSGDVNEAYTVSLAEGLKKAGFSLDPSLRTAYEEYLKDERAKQPADRQPFMPELAIPERVLTDSEIAAGLSTDIAIIAIGRVSGEFADRKEEDDFYLYEAEKKLIERVSRIFHAKGKKVVVVLNTGGVIETASWNNLVDATLLTWLPGQEAGNAIADILSGKVNPSGKLPTTFPVSYADDPTAEGFPGEVIGKAIDYGFIKTFPAEIDYDEGIFVGYRAFDKYEITPAYEFGYGLSYTSFEYSDLKLSNNATESGIEVILDVKVKNAGAVSGKEVVQLYLSTPTGKMNKPAKELKGFAKTRLLEPNESQVLVFNLDARALASFDELGLRWIAEKGLHKVMVGSSSRDIRLKAQFQLPKTISIAK